MEITRFRTRTPFWWLLLCLVLATTAPLTHGAVLEHDPLFTTTTSTTTTTTSNSHLRGSGVASSMALNSTMVLHNTYNFNNSDPNDVYVYADVGGVLPPLQPPPEHPTNASSLTAHRTLQDSRTVLILRVSGSGMGSPSPTGNDLYFRIFSDANSLKNQLSMCSAGMMQMNPTNWGVMDISVNAGTNTPRSQVVQMVEAAALARMPGYTNVRQAATHVVMVLPNRGDNFVGSAEICANKQSGTATLGDANALALSVLMHELGHNMGMDHSGYNGNEYGDNSGNMGVSSAQLGGPQSCYNACNHWHLGWFGDARLDLASAPDTPITVQVPAFVDYSEIASASDQYVLIKVGNLYMQYNRAKDHNAGTKMQPDKLTIVRNPAGTGMGVTNFMAGLDLSNPNWSDGSVTVQVCSVQINGNVDFMMVSIGRSYTNCQASGSIPAAAATTTTTTTTTVATPRASVPPPTPVTWTKWNW